MPNNQTNVEDSRNVTERELGVLPMEFDGIYPLCINKVKRKNFYFDVSFSVSVQRKKSCCF